MPVQRSSETKARVRSSACSSSVTGLRDRYASSHAIDVGCDGCAARQSSANCSPTVPPRYSTSALQCAPRRSNWSDSRAPSALSLDSVAGSHFSRVSLLRLSRTDCSTETPYAFQAATCSRAVYPTLWFAALSRSSRNTNRPACLVASHRCSRAHSRNRASSQAAPGSVQPAKSDKAQVPQGTLVTRRRGGGGGCSGDSGGSGSGCGGGGGDSGSGGGPDSRASRFGVCVT
jgi:hypothetical protein